MDCHSRQATFKSSEFVCESEILTEDIEVVGRPLVFFFVRFYTSLSVRQTNPEERVQAASNEGLSYCPYDRQ